MSKKKAVLPLIIARLQRVIAVEITDPAERAAIDKVRKRLKRESTRTEKMHRHQ